MCAMQATQTSSLEWEKREHRASELAESNPAATEVMVFYAAVLSLQKQVFVAAAREFRVAPEVPLRAQFDLTFAASHLKDMVRNALKSGPSGVSAAAKDLQQQGEAHHRELLDSVASTPLFDPSNVEQFFARAVLQPYAEALARQLPAPIGYSGAVCPFCDGAPLAAVLRPEGDGAKRFLLCSLCLREWEFRRVICAWCGEQDHHKLPRFGTDELPHVNVFACDTCKHYLKGVDLTVNGLAVPLVDEVAAAPLDLWATEQGYTKTVVNLLGM